MLSKQFISKFSVKFKQWSSEWPWNGFSLWRGHLWWWHQRNTWGRTRVYYSSTSPGFGRPCSSKITSNLAKLDYTSYFWIFSDLRIFIFDLFGPYWSILFGKRLLKKNILCNYSSEKKNLFIPRGGYDYFLLLLGKPSI